MPIVKAIYLGFNPELVRRNGVYHDLSQVLAKLSSSFEEVHRLITVSIKWKPKGKFLVQNARSVFLVGNDFTPQKDPSPPFFEGQPELAEMLVKSGEAAGLWIEGTEVGGITVSEWELFKLLAPEHRKVLPISLSQMSPEAHRKWGIAVKKGGQKWSEPMGILVTGSLSYRPDLLNLNPSLSNQTDGLPEQSKNALSDAKKFDEEVIRIFTSGSFNQMDEMNRDLFKAAQPEGGLASHYFLWGVLGDKAKGKLEYYSTPSTGTGCAVFSFSI
jgi:aromatic ring-opening dioxygenase catalytic subunit (LigB family)